MWNSATGDTFARTFVCFVNLPLPFIRRSLGRIVCSKSKRSLWVGTVFWNSEWKEVSPRPLVPLSFVKLFYCNIYVHTWYMCMCVCSSFFFLTKLLKHRVKTHGVSKVNWAQCRKDGVCTWREMGKVETVFKLKLKILSSVPYFSSLSFNK